MAGVTGRLVALGGNFALLLNGKLAQIKTPARLASGSFTATLPKALTTDIVELITE
jgi:hypothetical protein